MKNEPEHHDDDSRRIHYIPEWAERRNLQQSDIVREIGADKGLVSRWFKGVLPSKDYLDKLANLFAIDRGGLFRHPDDDWLYKYFRDKTEQQKERAIRILKAFLDDEDQHDEPEKPPLSKRRAKRKEK